MSDSWIYEGLNNLWSFHLTISGILITLITVLYSFLLNKREQYLSYIHDSRISKGPIIKKRLTLTKKYIQDIKKVIQHCFILLIISLILAAISIVTSRLRTILNIEKIIYIIILSITILWLLFVICLSYKLINRYREDSKI